MYISLLKNLRITENFPAKKIDEMKAGTRIELGEQKHNPLDFALWKKAKPGEPSWKSPWGEGRPGWHIECSTMSSKYLGLPFDIHGGGMDLRFPHHENEIAQAEASTGKQFARYWMHIGLLTVNGEKMSKSLGNIVNVSDLLKTWDPEIVRMFFAQTQYRSPPDFSEKSLTDVKKGLEKIYRLKEKLEGLSKTAKGKKIDENKLTKEEKKYLETIHEFRERFEQAMDDDFNTPKAVAVLFEFVNKSNKYLEENPNGMLCAHALDTLLNLGDILTLFQPKNLGIGGSDESILVKKLQKILQHYEKDVDKKNIEELLKVILDIREKARKEKDWKTADNIRKELENIGFEIQDTETGPVWRKK